MKDPLTDFFILFILSLHVCVSGCWCRCRVGVLGIIWDNLGIHLGITCESLGDHFGDHLGDHLISLADLLEITLESLGDYLGFT